MLALDNCNCTGKSYLVSCWGRLALANLVNSLLFKNNTLISIRSNVFHFFHSHCPHFGLYKGMNEIANYAKISLLKKKKKRKILGLTKTQSESFVSCCREKGANKRDKNKGNFSRRKIRNSHSHSHLSIVPSLISRTC